NFAGATFDHPFGLFDKTLVHVRRPAGRAGVAVSATDTERGQTLWETDLAVPPVATPTVDSTARSLALAHANGLVYRFDEQALRSRVQDRPLSPQPASAATAPPSKLTKGVDLGQGRAAFVTPTESDQFLMYDPAQRAKPAQWIKLPSTLACAV